MNIWTSHSHEDAPAGGEGGADAAAAAAAATQAAGGDAPLLQQGAGAENAWLPEKFRVVRDGSQDLDLEASARKLAASYGELEKMRPSTGTVPATAADYKIEAPKDAEGKPVEGIDIEAFTADPLFKDLAAKAHAAGISNETLNFFVGQYLQFIPGVLEANGQITVDEARAELAKVWNTDQAMGDGLKHAARAAQGFASDPGQPGSFDRLMEKFGNDPDFLAFAARIGSEMGEDKPIAADPVAQQDWQAQVDEIRADPAYADKTNPKHAGLMQKLEQLYQRRYGSKQQMLGGVATR